MANNYTSIHTGVEFDNAIRDLTYEWVVVEITVPTGFVPTMKYSSTILTGTKTSTLTGTDVYTFTSVNTFGTWDILINGIDVDTLLINEVKKYTCDENNVIIG